MSRPDENTADAENERGRRPFDRGLQPERTALAWQRTALALLIGSLIAGRILLELLGAWSLPVSGCGVLLSALLLLLARRRYRYVHRVLTTSSHDRPVLTGGGLAALTGAIALGIGLLGLAGTILQITSPDALTPAP